MKKIFSIALLSVLLILGFEANAKSVTPFQARQVATTFLRGMGCAHAEQLADHSAEMPYQHIYLFAAEKGGFVIVAADDCVFPILGYSVSGRFVTKNLPIHISLWLDSYEEQVGYYAGCGQANLAATEHWNALMNGFMPERAKSTSVMPLLTTTWGQAPFYNVMCPADSNSDSQHAVTGCTVTATTQVMKYWNFPTTGFRTHSYTHRTYGTLSADFGSTTYQWDNMPDSLFIGSSQAEMEAVGTLMYHAGVAVEMGYGPRGSGAQTLSYGDVFCPSAEHALRSYFKYKSSLHSIYRFDMPSEEYVNYLYAELDASRPMVYSGRDSVRGGHAFVLDGYDENGYFHVNWGWKSICDGYFAMGALNPSRGSGPRDNFAFNHYNGAIIGIEPIIDFDSTATTSVTATVSNAGVATIEGAGEYAFGDTVYLLVSTNEGYRFSGWTDGDKSNPRQFVATGGSFNFEANVQPLSGDTLGYTPSSLCLEFIGDELPVTGGVDFASSDHLRDYDSGDSSSNYWGIRLPASALTAGHSLKSVQMYVGEAGDYTLMVYLDSTNSVPVVVQNFSTLTADIENWKTIELDSPLAVSALHDLYITFYYGGTGHPIAVSFDGGNDDGILFGQPFRSIRFEKNNAVMIRGIFARDTNVYSIEAIPSDTAMGSVTGSGTYVAGDTVTLSAVPRTGYFFDGWSDGVFDNPRTLVVIENLTLVANFSHEPDGISVALKCDVSIYPNPTSGRIQVEAPSACTIRVLDPAGRQVARFVQATEIDLSSLAPGIYTLHILLPEGSVVKKVVRE